MNPQSIEKVIREGLRRKRTNAYRAAKDAGMPENAIRTVLEGRMPSALRLAEICEALDLEFYIGPPRTIRPHRIHERSLPHSRATRDQSNEKRIELLEAQVKLIVSYQEQLLKNLKGMHGDE